MDKLSNATRRDRGPIGLSRLGPLPLHYQISEQLRDEIARQELPVGAPLPSEADLVARFGVARGTIRQALATLRAEGSISVRRGAAPVVRGPRLSQPFTQLVSFSAWVGSLGMRPSGRSVRFVRRPASAALADALGLVPGERVYRLVRVRLADDEPLMIERTVFPAGVGALVKQLDLERQSIYAELGRRGVIFDSAHQTIDAAIASQMDARLLGIRVGAPLLRIRRLSLSPAGKPLEWSEDLYRSERVSLSVETLAARPSMARQLRNERGA